MSYIANTHPLDVEDKFPDLTFADTTQRRWSLPADFGDRWGVLLIYRGVWCGYCRRQLADFQANLEKLSALKAQVIAASVDGLDDAHAMVSRQGLTFPVGYGLDVLATAKTLGGYYESTDGYLQKCGFLLRPGGEIARATYSAGPVGALTAADCIYSLEFFQKNPDHRVGKLRSATA